MFKKINVIHPATIDNKISEIATGKKSPFEGVKRTTNKAFNKFMDKADDLSSFQKELEAEMFLYQKALKEHPEMIDLAEAIGTTTPKTNVKIEQYKADTRKLLKFVKESGAIKLHENMKIVFDLMIDQAEKGHLFKINTTI